MSLMKVLLSAAVLLLSGAASAADAEAGEKAFASCAACHGQGGVSAISANPSLAGQNERYLIKQLNDFKSGTRANAVMTAMSAGLTDEAIANIAAYLAEQAPAEGVVKADLRVAGEALYRGGNPETNVTACAACHSPNGAGNGGAGFPQLSGQHADYTATQLKAFRAAGRGDHNGDRRTNDGADGDIGMMQAVAARMTDDEIEAVSSFIQGLRQQ